MMEFNLGIKAMRKLVQMGYRFTVGGDTIKGMYRGQGDPKPHQVLPLLEVVRAHKDEVCRYLAHAQGNISSQSERILTCSECPWYQANPWTHYPDLPNWCGYHKDYLLKNNPACIGWRRGEIPGRPEARKP